MKVPITVWMRRTSALDARRAASGLLALTALAACRKTAQPDAYGNFESTEVVVSAQTSGQIRDFTAVEGARLARGALVAMIDTVQLALEREQVVAQRAATGARGSEVSAQLGVLEVQRDIARRAFERTQRLYAEHAATTQQLDQTEREYRTLVAQIEAARAQRRSVGMDVAASEARVAQIRERIAQSTVTNPQDGTVLTTYARSGEVVQPGQALYKIANLDTLVLRAYVTGAQLGAVRLGQRVQVHVDRESGALTTVPGTVTWVSSTAEFTPTPVQTRDERADLVYAVKIRVANEQGALKIGMPGDVTFGTASAPKSAGAAEP